MLVGRAGELGRVEQVLRDVRAGRSQALVITGEAGVAAMGVEAFAERARRELLATGETARKRTLDTGTQLTTREAQIAQLARDGLSNPEIGTRLFLGPRTVEYHLRKVFTKLAITSRTQLDNVLDGSGVAR